MHARGGMIRVRPQSFGQSENLQAHGLPVTGNIDCSLAIRAVYAGGVAVPAAGA